MSFGLTTAYHIPSANTAVLKLINTKAWLRHIIQLNPTVTWLPHAYSYCLLGVYYYCYQNQNQYVNYLERNKSVNFSIDLNLFFVLLPEQHSFTPAKIFYLILIWGMLQDN